MGLGMGMGAGRDLRRCVGELGFGERERTGEELGLYPLLLLLLLPLFDKAVLARADGT